MTIVAVNPGSSSIKLGVYTVKDNNHIQEIKRITIPLGGITIQDKLFQELSSYDPSDTIFGIRIVHGGWKYTTPISVDEEVYRYLETITPLAPLHLPFAIETIDTIRSFAPSSNIIAVFDTEFHSTMPSVARHYAIPKTIADTYHIYRYGFHGLAYASMLRLYATHCGIPENQATFIGIHLGSGCSMCAIQNGRSIDTTMGFSPLEGLPSRTRSGTIDPNIVLYLQQQTGQSVEAIMTLLTRDSGLKGLSQTDGHIQHILTANTADATFTIDFLIYKILAVIGSYDIILQTQAPLVLSGGISEHTPTLWKRLTDYPLLRVTLAHHAIDHITRPFDTISSPDSPRPLYIAFVNEEEEIARKILNTL